MAGWGTAADRGCGAALDVLQPTRRFCLWLGCTYVEGWHGQSKVWCRASRAICTCLCVSCTASGCGSTLSKCWSASDSPKPF